MSDSQLPQFDERPYDAALHFAESVLTQTGSDDTQLIELVAHEDGYFRAYFDPAYFILAEGNTEPSKSQWNTLKKKFKRHDRSAFVLKDCGLTDRPEGVESELTVCGTIAFGFLKPREK